MVRRRNLQSKSTLFLVLMAGAALASVLPERWTSWVRRPFQVLNRISRPAADVAAAVERATEPSSASNYSKDEVDALIDEAESLRLLVGHQNQMIEDQKWSLQELTGFRQKFPNSIGEIVIGRIEAYGTDPRRDMLVISPGSLGRVRNGDWVAAGVSADQLTANMDGRSALFRRWIIGQVVDAQPKFSRVQLVSDPEFHALVVPAGVEGRVWRIRGGEMVMRGAGKGKMVIESSTADYFSQDAPILLSAGANNMPARMVMGRITGAEQLVDSPLHYRLEIEPWEKPTATNTVFVIVPREPDAAD